MSLGRYAVVNLSDSIQEGELSSGLTKLRSLFGEPTLSYLRGNPGRAIQILNAGEHDTYFIAKGGTNCINLLDELDVSGRSRLIGYSDITHLFPALSDQGWKPVMGPTAGYFDIISDDSAQALSNAIDNDEVHLDVQPLNHSLTEVNGQIICGNDIAILSTEGTDHEPDFEDKILFIENHTDEPSMVEYWLDVYRAKGIVSDIKAMVVGVTSLDVDTLQDWAANASTPVYHSEGFCEAEQNFPIPYGGQASISGENAILRGFK